MRPLAKKPALTTRRTTTVRSRKGPMRNGTGYASWVPLCAMMAVGSVGAALGNPAHEQLLTKSAAEQAAMLGKAVGNGCIGTTPFFMGVAEDGSAFWSVLCANGNSYVVHVRPDAVGTAKALECSRLKAMQLDCFSLLPPEALRNRKSGIAL